MRAIVARGAAMRWTSPPLMIGLAAALLALALTYYLTQLPLVIK